MADQLTEKDAALKALQQDMVTFESDYAAHYQKAQADDARDYFKAVQNQQGLETPAMAQQQTQQAAMEDGQPGIAGKVGKDVTLGVMQSPRSVARGAIKGVNSMIGFIEGVNDLMPTITLLNEQGEISLPRPTTTGEYENRLEKRINKKRVAGGKEALPEGTVSGAPQLPVPNEPAIPTVTGKLIEGVTQFAVGLKGVDKLAKLGKVAEATGTAGKIAQSVGKGTLADLLAFDQHEQRLSNVIQEVPALQNPVTEYLQARDDDGFAEGKLKQAIEGAGLGLAGEVLFRGIGLLKRGKQAVRDMKTGGLTPDDLQNLPLSAQTGETFQKQALNTLGDVDDPRLLIPREARPAQVADDAGTAAVQKLSKAARATKDTQPGAVVDAAKSDLEGDIMINFARIEGPEDIKRAMQELANDPRLGKDVVKARRGAITDEQLMASADDVDGFSTLMQRRVGGTLNDSQTIAARKLYYDATDKLIESAKKAGESTASSYDQYVFRRMLAIHHAVQQDLLGARAEAARALRAWSIPVGGGNLDRLRGIEEALDNFGGVEATQDLAKRLTLMSQAGKMTTDQINQVARGGALARTGKAMQEAWMLGLLTSPRTHIVNVSSNVLTGLTIGAERYGMAAQGDIAFREANEFMIGYLGSFRQAMANAAQAWKTGQTGFGMGKIEAPFERATAREVLDPNGKAGIFSKALDMYGAALNRYVGGTLAAGDEFGKTTLYNAQLRALAARQAQRLGMKGQDVAKHIADVVNNPPPMMRSDAIEFANYGTFTNALGAGGAGAQKAINKIPGAKFVVPFVRTPLNIFKFTFERTPIGLLSGKIREDIAAGGVRKAAAMSKLGMGTSVMMLGTDMALNGEITGAGPVDPETRSRLMSAGWKPYSIKIGDKYYSYSRFEPFATWLGMSADMAEILGNYEAYDMAAQEEVDELATAMVAAIANQVVGKTFMSGISDLTQVLSDSKRYGPQYLQQYAGSLVPNAVADIEKMVSPEREQVFNMLDAVKARIPGLSESVPKRYNVYGEVIKNYYPDPDSRAVAFGERAMQAFNPVYFSDKDAPSQKLDEWFLTSGVDGPNMPQKVQNFEVPGDFTGGKIAVDLREYPEIYERFLQLRSEKTLPQYENVNMKEYLIRLVNKEVPYSRVFFMGLAKNKEDQAGYITSVVGDYDRAIRKQLVDEFPVLRQTIAEERTKQIPLQGNAGGEGLVRQKPFP